MEPTPALMATDGLGAGRGGPRGAEEGITDGLVRGVWGGPPRPLVDGAPQALFCLCSTIFTTNRCSWLLESAPNVV